MRWLPRTLGLAAALVLAADPARAVDAPVDALSAKEVARLLAHGPWPPSVERDPSNRASGDAAAVAFGRRMFHEPRLSANGYVACIACHQTNRGWTDGIARARGLAPVARNAPAVSNAALSVWFGWSGASDSLWMASLRPILDEREMGSNAAAVARLVRTGDGLACEYQRAFGRSPEAVDDEAVLVDVAKALAAFQETLTTGRTAFDDYRDALARGDREQAARYPAQAARGALLFVGKAGCASCHAGANFTDGSFRAVTRTSADAGRSDGIRDLRSSRFNLAGSYNDDPVGSKARVERTRALQARPAGRGDFRVPSLRNVAVTPPYLHDGSHLTLRDAVRHGPGATLSESNVDELIAFLATLTDSAGAERPQQRPEGSTCR